MSSPAPPPAKPWWKRWWGIVYLVLLGLVTAFTLRAAAIPGTGEAGRLGRDIGLALGVLWLGILFEIGVVVAVFRRRFWRQADPVVELLLSVGLIFLSTAAVGIFCFLACAATGTIRLGEF